MSIFARRRPSLITSAQALPGRSQRPFTVPTHHAVLGTPLECPNGFPADLATIYVAMGCFWGAERRMWRLPGVYTTAVGYQGGYTPHPTYEEVCTGLTGHTETVLVVYDPQQVSTYDILKTFWENHDPTQGNRQGNDIGTQYRSAVFTTTHEQVQVAESTLRLYQAVLTSAGLDPITTAIRPAAGDPFYYAEPYHQQYLHKVPNGYDCHANTGYSLPPLSGV
jgi:peptide-methionine (S)-S-oxide reductase